jgi:hypothetical protein
MTRLRIMKTRESRGLGNFLPKKLAEKAAAQKNDRLIKAIVITIQEIYLGTHIHHFAAAA